MLRWRILLGALFIGGLVGLCWLDVQQVLGGPPGAWLLPLALVLSLAASDEMLRLVGTAEEKPIACIVMGGNLAIVAAGGAAVLFPGAAAIVRPMHKLGWPLTMFVLAVLAVFIGEIVRYEKPGRVVVRIGLAVLTLAYVGLLLAFIVQLRLMRGNVPGMTALVSLIAVVKMGDTGAYTLGRIFGRNKMTPRLSPGKTWEGAAGAILFAAAGAWIVFRLSPTSEPSANSSSSFCAASWLGIPPPWNWLSYGIVVGIAGMLGDLAESLIKRDAGQKDSSSWMPGFGGVLDILDSILFAAPVAWLLWTIGWV